MQSLIFYPGSALDLAVLLYLLYNYNMSIKEPLIPKQHGLITSKEVNILHTFLPGHIQLFYRLHLQPHMRAKI